MYGKVFLFFFLVSLFKLSFCYNIFLNPKNPKIRLLPACVCMCVYFISEEFENKLKEEDLTWHAEFKS